MSISKANIAALIVAGGSSTRFNQAGFAGEISKVYQNFNDIPLINHSIDIFIKHPQISVIQVVIHPRHLKSYEKSINLLADQSKLRPVVFGGDTRQQSVFHGLRALQTLDCLDYVLIHDGARPNLGLDLVDRVLVALEDARDPSGVVPAVACNDSLVRKAGQGLSKEEGCHYVNRAEYFRAQTPQGFVFREIFEAHSMLKGQQFSDDGSLFQHSGGRIKLVLGSQDNKKITYFSDL